MIFLCTWNDIYFFMDVELGSGILYKQKIVNLLQYYSYDTSKSYEIIRKAEGQLMNERVRNINSSLYMFGMRGDTCSNQLAVVLEKKPFSEYQKFLTRIKQAMHLKTLTRQVRQFYRLQYKYYGGVCSYSNKYVYNVGLLNQNLHISSNNTGNDNTKKNNNRINNNEKNDNNKNNSKHRGESDNNDDETNKNGLSTCLTPPSLRHRDHLWPGHLNSHWFLDTPQREDM